MKYFILISFLIHLSLIWMVRIFNNEVEFSKQRNNIEIEVANSSPIQNKIDSEKSSQQKKDSLEIEANSSAHFIQNQATSINSDDFQKTNSTRFISSKSNVVEHETSARTPGSEQKPGLPEADSPTAVIIDKVVGENGSPSYDVIDNLDPGVETLLNSKETVFYDYFSEIRKKINSTWTPLIRIKIKNILMSAGDIDTLQDEVTRCLVSLDSKGRVLKIQIIGKSKYRELDDAAVEAFKLATPLSPPPKDLSDNRGQFLIRWDFIIDS